MKAAVFLWFAGPSPSLNVCGAAQRRGSLAGSFENKVYSQKQGLLQVSDPNGIFDDMPSVNLIGMNRHRGANAPQARCCLVAARGVAAQSVYRHERAALANRAMVNQPSQGQLPAVA